MPTSIPQKINEFFTTFPLRTYNKRQLIIRPEEPLSGVFYITEGLVSQYDVTPSGNEVVVNVFKPGAFFPMSTALNGTPNLYFFEASTNVRTHIAPPVAAVQFLRDNPDVALDLLTRVYRGVDGVLRRMAHLMGGDAKHRLLFELLNASYRFGEPQTDDSIYLPLKEGDVGKLSGLARETVNRNMQVLRESGLIQVVRGGLQIKDVKHLEKMLSNEI